MGWILAIIVGAIIGALFSYIVRPERRNTIADAISGAAGGLLGAWFFGNFLGLGAPLTAVIGTFTMLGLLWVAIGAIVITAIVQAAIFSGAERSTQERGPAYHEEYRDEDDWQKRHRRDRDDKWRK